VRLLVVDDDYGVLDAIKEVLEDEGYEVSLAADGLEALKELRLGQRPCMILLDLMMPVMNGWDFRQEQLRDEILASIPTIIITADGRADQKSADLKTDGFLKKPVNPDQLMAVVEKHCGKSSLA
jgi:CheY-like chemotaxis protein